MFGSLFILLICGILYMIKGGQHRSFRLYLEHKAGIEHDAQGHPIGDLSIHQWLAHRLLDGKALSGLIFGALYMVAASDYGVIPYVFAVAMWLAAVSPKMGRIVGKIGGLKGNWDENEQPYQSADDTDVRMAIEGWKDGIIRGVYMGACMAVLFDNADCIWFGALYPATAFVGTSIEQWRSKIVAAPWVIHEAICGVLCLGLGVAISTM